MLFFSKVTRPPITNCVQFILLQIGISSFVKNNIKKKRLYGKKIGLVPNYFKILQSYLFPGEGLLGYSCQLESIG